MDKQALLQRLMKTFVSEVDDHIKSLERDLLALERGPASAQRAEIFKTLFRTAHSLKGAARSVDVEPIEAVSHRLELIFADVRDGRLGLDAGLFEILLAAVDAIKEAARRLAAGDSVDAAPIAPVLAELKAMTRIVAGEKPCRAADPVPTADGLAPDAAPAAPLSEVPPPSLPPASAASAFVRVHSSKLDALLAHGGELLVARRRIERRSADIARLIDMVRRWEGEWRRSGMAMRGARAPSGAQAEGTDANSKVVAPARMIEQTTANLDWLRRRFDGLAMGLTADHKALEQVAVPLEAELLQARMAPFTTACEGLERAVRDLARAVDKKVDLTIVGGDVEIDRSIIEVIRNPLLHLVRNAVDHGIESVAARKAAGKPARARITLKAVLRNARVEISVADDGRGLDLAAIRARAQKLRVAMPESDRDIARLVLAPNFSTASDISMISGRGVGLDVVRTAVEARRGSIDIAFEPGVGTRMTIGLPASLTRITALLVAAGGQTYALDGATVDCLVRLDPEGLRTMEGRDVAMLDGGPVPVRLLSEVLGQPGRDVPRTGAKVPAVVLGAGADRVAFVVDELLAEEDVVVKDLGARLRRVDKVGGATVLANGHVALVLNAADLVHTAVGQGTFRSLCERLAERPAATSKRLLVADDSLTTRTLVKSILEAEGYDVIARADGMEAWSTLQEDGADLVVSDVEMPRMDGFALTEAIRGSKRFRDLPVILVTGLESESDKLHGLDVGADAYLRKSAFDQTDLIRAISQFL